MTERGTEGAALTWSAQECPFRIEASARVLDDIRLAVTDAFFSLPRGGAEIGGILLGTFAGDTLVITDHAALECEHAFGPSFALSPPDEARLTQLIAAHDGCAGGLRPVGWYHSHTRSDIFLSDADLAIHERFFPDSRQVALVLKPHTFQPTRFGFFFREADGSVHASAPYREDELEALPMRQVPAGPPPPTSMAGEGPPRNLRPSPTFAPIVDIPPAHSAVAAASGISEAVLAPPPSSFSPAPGPPVRPFAVPPPPQTAAGAAPPDTPSAVPSFVNHPVPPPYKAPPAKDAVPADTASNLPLPNFAVENAASARKWMTLAIAIVGGLGVAAAAYKTSDMWLPKMAGSARAAKPSVSTAAPALGLATFDREGQLQISWDRTSATVRNAASGVLEIAEEGAAPKAIQLDAASLQNGSFTYARTAAKVDLKLAIHQKTGPEARESVSFLGKAPDVDRKAKEEAEASRQREAAAIRERDELAKQTEKMKADLNSQAAKTKKLEKDMQVMRNEMRQQKRRMANQVPDK
jgi:proteasome lid subunit RPN8/RPN11